MYSNPPAEPLTFAGLPPCSDIRQLQADIAIIGVPFGVPYPYQELHAATAPYAIRRQSQRLGHYLDHYDFTVGGPVLGDAGVRIVDCGDVPQVAQTLQSAMTEDAIRTILEHGAIPVVLGGDHSTTIPVIRSFEDRGPLCVVQVDAHIDFRDEVEGVRDGLSSGMRRASELSWVDDIVQIGLRGVGSAKAEDVEASREAGCIHVLARDIHRQGIDLALEQIPEAKGYYITLDMDGVDPSIAPGVIAPSFGGLTYLQVLDLLQGIAQRGPIVGMDVVEVAAEQDPYSITISLAAQLALDAIGVIVRGRL